MPNWCTNRLEVSGKDSNIKSFLQFIKGKDGDGESLVFDFEKVSPTPPELLAVGSPNTDKELAEVLKEKYGAEDWYQWRLNNWGTKWNLSPDIEWDVHKGLVILLFDTAWSPPLIIMKALGIKFPNLSFSMTYCEPGMGFAGLYEVKGTEIIGKVYDWQKDKSDYEIIAKDFGYDLSC